MGLIRLLLALSVLSAHTAIPIFVGGKYAVELFFVISGFLISYLLIESKRYSTLRHFYLSRWLRLYPVYVLIFLLMLAFNIGYATVTRTPNIFEQISLFDWRGQIILWFANVTMLLQDTALFFSQRGSEVVFGAPLTEHLVHWHTGLLNPPAWSLSLEIAFYLIAPFVVTRLRTLVVVLAFSLAIKGSLLYFGVFGQDPWSYRFFPAELSFFLLGSLAHRTSLRLRQIDYLKYGNRLGWASTSISVLSLVGFQFVAAPEWLRAIGVIAAVTVCLPFMFRFPIFPVLFNKLGNLSYPIYLAQILVMQGLSFGLALVHFSLNPLTYLVLAGSLACAFAWVLENLVIKRIDRFRYSVSHANSS